MSPSPMYRKIFGKKSFSVACGEETIISFRSSVPLQECIIDLTPKSVALLRPFNEVSIGIIQNDGRKKLRKFIDAKIGKKTPIWLQAGVEIEVRVEMMGVHQFAERFRIPQGGDVPTLLPLGFERAEIGTNAK